MTQGNHRATTHVLIETEGLRVMKNRVNDTEMREHRAFGKSRRARGVDQHRQVFLIHRLALQQGRMRGQKLEGVRVHVGCIGSSARDHLESERWGVFDAPNDLAQRGLVDQHARLAVAQDVADT